MTDAHDENGALAAFGQPGALEPSPTEISCEDRISQATLFAYMIERENIRKLKETGAPAPWTSDPILKEYSFTNVRRSDDRTTRELLANFYRPNVEGAPPGDVLFNCAIGRFFAGSDVCSHIGWQSDWQAAATVARLGQWTGKTFPSAYVITNNGQTGSKVEFICHQVLTPLWEARNRVAEATMRESGWRFLIGQLRRLPALGGTGFMAKEVAQDFMLAMGWLPRDRDTYTPVGKGARRGLNRLHGRALDYRITSSSPDVESRFLSEVRKLFAMRSQYLPNDFVELQLHDIQFNLCELDKYLRAKNGEGKPKRRYGA